MSRGTGHAPIITFLCYLGRFIPLATAFLLLAWGTHSFWFNSLPRADLQVGGQSVRAIVADHPRSLSWGLMFRHALPASEGMLFVYPAHQRVCMWMSNTFIPLSVGFIGEDGVIVGIDDMAPGSRESHCAPVPVRYALEVPLGWFTTNAVKVGSTVAGLPRLPPAQRLFPSDGQ